ncbi:MAG: hypothetical protein U9O53_05110, partial [archaeon]|nr:hypothetical protein [archaeon]
MSYAASPAPEILLVDDDGSQSSFISYYTDALDMYGYGYTVFEVGENDPSYTEMQNYDLVVWFTGEQVDTLTEEDIGNLTEYFDNGGNMFFSSVYAGLDISETYPDFYENYLHAEYGGKRTIAWYRYLNGIDDDPISDSSFGCLNYYVNNIFSIIRPNDGSVVYDIIYYYKKDNGRWGRGRADAAVKADTGTFKVVYFGIAFESIVTNSDTQTSEQLRAEMMNNIINYLYTPNVTISDIDPPETSANITIYADCYDPERFSHIQDAEYYLDDKDLGDGNNNPMPASDGLFNTHSEEANITINTTLLGLDNGPYTVHVHCQDKDGYWGKYDNMTFIVDRNQPPTPNLEIIDTSGYTNSEIVSLNLTTENPLNETNLHHVAFSCNDIAFTEYYTIYESDQNGTDFLIYHINLTDTALGCLTTDGERTVYVRAKSRANVENATHNSDTTTLDRIPPSFTSVNVSDPDTYYKAEDTITLDINMSEQNLILTADLSAIDPNFSPNQSLTDKGDGTYNLTTSSLNQATMIEGIRTIKITATDLAGNGPVSDSSLAVTLDKTTPDTPEMIVIDNSGYTNDETPVLFLTASANPPDYISFSCNNTQFTEWFTFSGTGVYTCFNMTNTSAGCSASDGSREIYIKARDTAGNENATHNLNTTILDREMPEIDSLLPQNNSNITDEGQFYVNVSDDKLFRSFSYNSSGDEINPNNISGNETHRSYIFTPPWLSEGINNMVMKLKDIAGNINQQIYSYFVDNTDPITSDNYSLSGWQGTDLQVNLTCTDGAGSGCNTTKYCIANLSEGDCSPDTIGTEIDIDCTSGTSCEKKIYYFSTDYSGNTEDTKSSSTIKIDRTPPEITIENPIQDKIYTSVIQILTIISDEDNGTISYADYNITNQSSGISVADGSLNSTGDWDASWNSSSCIITGYFNLTVFANDSLGNNITALVKF